MPNDVADDTAAAEEPQVPSLLDLGLIGALARALDEHQTSVIQPKKDAPKEPLIEGFVKSRQSDLVVEVGGQVVGTYKVPTTNDKFVVADEAAFDAYAEEKEAILVTIARDPAWEKAVLAHARMNPATGDVFDSRSGEAIPGLKFVPGGQPTGSVRFTWNTFKGQAVGKAALLAAWQRGELNELLRETPELMAAGVVPQAEDA
ncbi:hypothetical protein [Streptomyces longispororuber]|uniref:hypothetical protein n=1 Tax=Streptomyces longispororuber TaxID=68230 RepID=UPI0036FEC77D